ncbi:MAG TPA: pyridoxine 5'-phosphate synthase, partial [Gemmataceae bacterium]
GGLDVVANESAVGKAVERLLKAGIEVSMFIDPDIQQIDVSKALGATAVELQTARYSEARTPADVARELDALRTAAAHARDRGLAVHAGHGLTYANVQAVARIPGMRELNIGHSIVSRAVLVGMERAVREMKEAMN